MSPDGRWLTCQLCNGTMLVDLDQPGLVPVAFWTGGEKRCYWDASSSRSPVGIRPTWSMAIPGSRSSSKTTSGNWPAIPKRIPYSSDEPPNRTTFDLTAGLAVIFGQRQLECIDLESGASRWRRGVPTNEQPMSIVWSGDDFKLLYRSALYLCHANQGRMEIVTEFEDADANSNLYFWNDRFADEGTVVWRVHGSTVFKIDAETGAELLRYAVPSGTLYQGFSPDSSWVVSKNIRDVRFFDPAGDKTHLVIGGTSVSSGSHIRFSRGGHRVLMTTDDDNPSSATVLTLQDLP
ncbi:MAG: hypothetical protein R3B96_02450 [Pirellulaceae bacterium]